MTTIHPRGAELGTPAPGTIGSYLPMFKRRLVSNGRSPSTITGYLDAAQDLDAWLAADRDRPRQVADIDRGAIEDYQIDYAGRTSRYGQPMKPSTVASRNRCLRQFFAYLEGEQIIPRSPMTDMPIPDEPELAIPVLSDDAVDALIEATAGAGPLDRRDRAVVYTAIDCGGRLRELTGMTIPNTNLDKGTIFVPYTTNKGKRKDRTVTLGNDSVVMIDRWLMARMRMPQAAGSDRLWIGAKGPLTSAAIASMLDRRAKLAGIGHIHPHQLRHTWAHRMKKGGVQPDEFKALGGWSTDTMPDRYGRALLAERAIESGRRLSPMDRRPG